MKESVLQRVILFFESQNISESAFAKRIGSNQKTLNQQLKGERSISIDTIINIISSFEELNSEWLLKGEGSMFKEKIGNNISQQGTANTVGNISVQGNYSAGNSHNINLVLPEKGYQKIISSSGKETTIRLSDDDIPAVENLSTEVEHLKQINSELRARIAVKDELLASKEEIINMYRFKAKES